ncbi:MAG: hypothetical protein ACXVBU_15740 [Ktedonobacteraceae bacterium]
MRCARFIFLSSSVEPAETRFSFERTAELRVYSTASLKKRKREGLLEGRRASILVDQSRGIRRALCKEYGLGMAKAAQLKAALEIGRRLTLSQLEEKYQIKSPADAANLVMMEMAFLPLARVASLHRSGLYTRISPTR